MRSILRRHHEPLALLCSLAVLAAGCAEPEVDELRSEGGASPDPTGVIVGTVLYVGPRPQCTFRGGSPVEPIGRVILTLFEHDNPPPPAGSASSAENLLTIPGARLFTNLVDCLPEGEDPSSDPRPIMRSVAFVWPEIELDPAQPRVFQIRGFYDYDADFNPFFSVTNQPTRGDVVGGAFVDIVTSPPRFLPIAFPSARAAPNGAVNEEPTVTLASVASTTRPMFELGAGTMPLSSEATIPPEPDPVRLENALFALASASLSMFPRMLAAEQRAAFDAAGLGFDLGDPRAYAWYVRELDVDGDGTRDPHPIIGGTAGVPWLSPAMLMRRLRSPAETAAGFPDALLIPTPRPTDHAFGRMVHYPTIDVIVPPVAVVVLDPELPECRVPYVPPGNLGAIYRAPDAPIPTECHELPTGNYGVAALHGFAGAQFVAVPEGVSPTGFAICEGDTCPAPSFTGQVWQVPNELADPGQLGDPGAVLASQSIAGTFVVFDPDTATSGGGGSVECRTSLEGTTIDAVPVPAECCEAVRAFCGLPLCDPIAVPAGAGVAGQMIRGPGTDTDADGELDCTPFAMPASCCP